MLASGAKDKEHAMSQTPNTAIAVIGIDIGKNSSRRKRSCRLRGAGMKRRRRSYRKRNRQRLAAHARRLSR
jgi:hypothetical protein